MRKTFAALALATLVIIAGPTAAQAAEDTDGYPPRDPSQPTVTGSTAAGVCDDDSPWIQYSVQLTDPDAQSATSEASLVLSGSGDTVTIPLGTLQDGRLSGRVLWPGASVDANGVPNGWPGWTLENGQWVETDGNFAWTRGSISATIEVNPSVSVPLSYPPQTPVCAVNPPVTGASAALPATGMSAAVLPIGIAGGVLAVLGAVLLVGRRLARR